MRKIIKNISFGLLTAGLIVGTALPTFAAYDEASGDAGSTRVYCEVGFNGGTSYAMVSANEYVDASMDGEAFYSDGETVKLIGGFDQKTYGEVSRTRDCDAAVVSCKFYVSSEDGDYSHFCYAH